MLYGVLLNVPREGLSEISVRLKICKCHAKALLILCQTLIPTLKKSWLENYPRRARDGVLLWKKAALLPPLKVMDHHGSLIRWMAQLTTFMAFRNLPYLSQQ